MKQSFTTILLLFIFSQLCFAAGSEKRRVDIYVDEDLYKDAEVLDAIKNYAGIVETNHNVAIDIKSFPAALVLNNNLQFEQNSTAEELKGEIKKSWQKEDALPLAGAILIGNLPYAEMEYFVRESDGYPAQSLDESIMRYQVWTTDLFYMDLDGEWKDEITGVNCGHEQPCSRITAGSNGIYDRHYSKSGVLGTDDFEIWVTRVNPYGEARKQSNFGWQQQLQNYTTEYFPEVKAMTLRWLDKAYKQQTKTTPRSDKVLFSYSSHSTLRDSDFPVMNFIRDFSNLYNRTDIIAQSTKEPYLQSITEDYDWSLFMGHGAAKFINNGASITDFDEPLTVNARFFYFVACNTMRTVSEDGLSYDRAFGYDHIFRTLDGGVTAFGYTKNSGGYQDDESFYSHLSEDLVGDAFLKWVNHRTLVFDKSRYPQEVYDWFYAASLIGDPFIKIEAKHKDAKLDSVPQNVAIYATNDIHIGGTCYDLSQGPKGRCSIVNDNNDTESMFATHIWGDADVGSIYVREGFMLDDNAKVKNVSIYNTYREADLFVKDSAQYDVISFIAPQSWNPEINQEEPIKDFSVFNCFSETVDSVYTLTDGECIHDLVVNPKGKVIFPSGKFYVGTLNMKEDSGYKLENEDQPSILHVGRLIGWNGEYAGSDYENAASNFKLVLHNTTGTIHLENNFIGSIYAPQATLNFIQKTNNYGTYYARDISLHENAAIYFVPPSPALDSLNKEKNVITTINGSHALGDHKITAFNKNTISFIANKTGTYKVQVMSVDGSTVASLDVNAHIGINNVSWNIRNAAKGRYFVSVKQGDFSDSRIFTLK
ncbi:MAG: C25 family cysteine peptidase [Fibrobacter sp.]|nr:C25 family cysteine peptidase [Fibrobacter sp.]